MQRHEKTIRQQSDVIVEIAIERDSQRSATNHGVILALMGLVEAHFTGTDEDQNIERSVSSDVAGRRYDLLASSGATGLLP